MLSKYGRIDYMDTQDNVEVKVERYEVSKKLKVIAWLTTLMGFMLFSYPVVFILSLMPSLKEYKISGILYYLNKIYFLTIPNLVASYVPTEINEYIAFAVIYTFFAILFMVTSSFLLERNLLAIAFAFVIFLSLSVSEYLINPELNIKNLLSYHVIFYLIFSLIPLILMILEIVTKKDFKNEQFYVKILSSALIISALILFFKSLIWLIQNRQWVIDTFSLLTKIG